MDKKLHPSDAVYSRVIGKYYAYAVRGSDRDFMGKLTEIIDGLGTLNPSVVVEYDPEKGPRKRVAQIDTFVKLEETVGMNPTTNKGLRDYCAYFNSQVEKSNDKDSIEPNN